MEENASKHESEAVNSIILEHTRFRSILNKMEESVKTTEQERDKWRGKYDFLEPITREALSEEIIEEQVKLSKESKKNDKKPIKKKVSDISRKKD